MAKETIELKEKEKEEIDSFFIINNKTPKLNQTTTKTKTKPTTITQTNTEKETNSLLLLKIPKRPKEIIKKTPTKNQIKKTINLPPEINYNSSNKSNSPFSTLTDHSHHQPYSYSYSSSSSPPPLPPPLKFPRIDSREKSKKLLNSISFMNKRLKPNTHQLSPHEPEFNSILVPDSTQNSPEHCTTLKNIEYQSHFGSHFHLEKEAEEQDDDCHLSPKLLFRPSSSSPPPPLSPLKFLSSYSDDRLNLKQSSSKSTFFGREEETEEEKRKRLISQLGFDEPEESELTITTTVVEPLTSSPIVIIQCGGSKETEPRANEKKKQKMTPSRFNKNDQSSSSHLTSNNSKVINKLLFATPQDQIRHVGVIVDDSDDELDGAGNHSGIAPLMNSWPASKRTIFMRMAGLNGKETAGGREEERRKTKESEAKEVEEWDQLLNLHKSKSSNIKNSFPSSSSNKKTFTGNNNKRAWNFRKFSGRRKKSASSSSSSSFKFHSSASKPSSRRFVKKKI